MTSVQRTLIDLAGTLDDTKLDVALDSALRANRGLEPLLTQVVSQLTPNAYPGLSTLREMLVDRQVTDSALEVEVRRLVWAADMPQPMHFNVFAGDRWIGEVDFRSCHAQRSTPTQQSGTTAARRPKQTAVPSKPNRGAAPIRAGNKQARATAEQEGPHCTAGRSAPRRSP